MFDYLFDFNKISFERISEVVELLAQGFIEILTMYSAAHLHTNEISIKVRLEILLRFLI